MNTIRALVVEDSVTVRKYLVDLLRARREFEVIGEAEDGKQAIELCERLRPDVITLDLTLPLLSGLAATEYIMAYCPTPIVIVSGTMNRGEAFKTYDVLTVGAVDVLEKPPADNFDRAWEHRFVETVRVVSRVKVITHPRGRLRRPLAVCPRVDPSFFSARDQDYRCVAIGASTGGPQTLATLLRDLPADFSLPIVIVMHISLGFGETFAAWLNDQSPIPVVTAKDGDSLPPRGVPRVILAPPDRHLTVRHGRLRLNRDPEVHSCRPSVDVLFESLAAEFGQRNIGVVLTGMGRDGARGLLAIKQAGGMTIAQDEKTSIVFGMPREAIRIGAAKRTLPLGDIAAELTSLATVQKEANDNATARADRR
jgi:two-component system chemotaxis response regulator CheB